MIKSGDLVVAQGHEGIFRIYTISQDGKSAEIELFSVSRQQPVGHSLNVPTSTLSPFKEDASQAAARIVREATEDQ